MGRGWAILDSMRPLFIVSSTRYTGAGAVAEHCCRAVRKIGVDASLLYTAGDNFEQRLAGESWAHAGLVKERSLADLRHTLRTIRRSALDADLIVTHLQHDHTMTVLSRAAALAPIIRSFRNPSCFRRDPWHRWLGRPIAGALLAHSGMTPYLARHCGDIPSSAFPVPLEDRFEIGPDPECWRRNLEIPYDVPVLGMVGKLAAGRGFDLLIDVAAALGPPLHAVIVGHGEARPELEARAARRGIDSRIRWAGYREAELPELYAAMDVVLYPAVGSDHGHRAISEAQACGKPVVAADHPGVSDLIADAETGLIVERSVDALAEGVRRFLDDRSFRESTVEAARREIRRRRFRVVGGELRAFFQTVLEGARSEIAPRC